MADILVPAIGESITEVTLTQWLVENGSFVNEGDLICEIESDKATLEMPSEHSGVIKFMVEGDSELEIGAKIAEIDTEATAGADSSSSKEVESSKKEESNQEVISSPSTDESKPYPSPAAGKIMKEKGVSPSDIKGSGKDGRITKEDAMKAKGAQQSVREEEKTENEIGGRKVREEKMTRLRKTIAKVLVEAKNTTAMLTTFNEVDMFPVMEVRKKFKESFKEKHNIGLGFMSFFTKASTMALKLYPGVNGQINGDKLLYHDYADVGIAVSTPKGLIVPVVRNAESMSFAQIEKKILELALKARDGKITLEEMRGGTFTITNGGVFGSMLSTPIINLPQSGILGMHNIVQRPVAINGQVVIRPVMYIALSYDHRIVDGRESVGFLKTVKELIEDPHRMLLDV
jgi:2-oxoglutarate dehydrogenase E2 component (dihydrolipoamide succinyltransferase)